MSKINQPIIIFFSGNQNKVLEVENAFNEYNYNNNTQYQFLSVDIDIEEIQAVSVNVVIEQKIKDSLKELEKVKNKLYLKINNKKKYVLKDVPLNNIILICEDTGLGIKKMGTYQDECFPGALIKFYLKALNSLFKGDKEQKMHSVNRKIVKDYGGSKVYSKTCFGAKGNIIDKTLIFQDVIEGIVSTKYKKDGAGFDFDYFIEPKRKNGKTISQLIELGDVNKPRYNIIMNQIAPLMHQNNITQTKLFNKNKNYESRILKLD